MEAVKKPDDVIWFSGLQFVASLTRHYGSCYGCEMSGAILATQNFTRPEL